MRTNSGSIDPCALSYDGFTAINILECYVVVQCITWYMHYADGFGITKSSQNVIEVVGQSWIVIWSRRIDCLYISKFYSGK